MKRIAALIPVILIACMAVRADSLAVHRIEADLVPSGVLPTNKYLRGGNPEGERISHAMAVRLKYAFQHNGDSQAVAAYQGIGVGYMFNHRLLGNPVEVYVVQGAPIVRLSPSLTLNYEVQFGGSFGWKNVGSEQPENHVLGSRANFYIGTDLYLCWRLSPHWDFNLGGSYLHASSASLSMPNEGLNMVGARASLAYYLNRSEQTPQATILSARQLPKAERWVTDVMVYGGWKKKSRLRDDTYGVAGFSVSPTFYLNEALAIGPAIDGVYDRSVNVPDLQDKDMPLPAASNQLALGLQARAELTLPVMRISGGAGCYVGGFTAFYETIAIKFDLTRRLFLNVGYCLYNYKYPNNLMLGVGYRLRKHQKQ